MDTRLPCLKANKGLLNSAVGPLQRQLRSGEYNLFKFATMFESDFVQVSKRGGTSDVHNHVQLVRVAVAATSPSLQVPNVLLLARPVSPSEEQTPSLRNMFCRSPGKVTFELTRLLPLCFVKISVHDWEKQQLRFKMATGRTFYLQLFPQEGQADDFESWVKIIQLLRPPADLHLEKRKREADLLKKGEPVLLSADVTPAESSEPQHSEDGPCSTIAEILSILQEEPQDDEPNPGEPSESLAPLPEKVSFAVLASKEEELRPTRSFALLPSGEDEPKAESPPPSEGPQEEPRRTSDRPRKKAQSKGRSGSRKKTARSKSRRSRSAQKVSRSSSAVSSLLTGSYSSTHQTRRRRLTKSREKKR